MYVKCHDGEDKDEMACLVPADEGDLDALPLSVSSVVHGRTAFDRSEKGARRVRDIVRIDVRSGRSNPLDALQTRPASTSSDVVAGRRGLPNGSTRRASTPQGLIPARTSSSARAGFATLHEAPVRPRSFGSMPRFASARK